MDEWTSPQPIALVRNERCTGDIFFLYGDIIFLNMQASEVYANAFMSPGCVVIFLCVTKLELYAKHMLYCASALERCF